MKYLIVDSANLFFRVKHVASRQSDAWDRVGFSIHATLASVAKAWREQEANHVVFCLEGKSWRKKYDARYKANRAVARAARTEAEVEEDELFFEAYGELQEFLIKNTNCTVLQHMELEADDLISAWIQSHPDDEHVIVSSDTDFYQLIAPNVEQYNGITDTTISINGFFNGKGQRINDKKTKRPVAPPEPEWILFEKCIRGDASDNVFSAYPGARVKSSKNKVGLREAFEDRSKKGYAWNNLMLQRWTDHNGVEHKVHADYDHNVRLIDLKAQPDDIKVKMFETVATAQEPKDVPMVGAKFLKFCGKYELTKLSDQATVFGLILSAKYNPQ